MYNYLQIASAKSNQNLYENLIIKYYLCSHCHRAKTAEWLQYIGIYYYDILNILLGFSRCAMGLKSSEHLQYTVLLHKGTEELIKMICPDNKLKGGHFILCLKNKSLEKRCI